MNILNKLLIRQSLSLTKQNIQFNNISNIINRKQIFKFGTPIRTCISVCQSANIPSPINTTVLFDTASLVKTLRDGGISQDQSEVLVTAFTKIMQINAENMSLHLVTKAQQEIVSQQIMAHISSLRKDMIVLERSEFSSLKHEYEKQGMRIQQLERMLHDEVDKIKNGTLLDINMERSRSIEAHNDSEKSITKLSNRLDMEGSQHDKHFSVMDKKIEKESANLLAIYERYRNDVLKYAAGAVISSFTLLLGFMRVMM